MPDRLDIDALMREIRAEVGARLPAPGMPPDAMDAAPGTPRAAPPLPRLGAFAEDLPKKGRYHATDFLAFHDEDFVRQAYRRILGREPDRDGASRYLAKIRAGELARIEVLGRIRFSTEGRAAGVPVAGLALPFALRTARRVPLIGRVIGIVQYLWRLPDLAHNHEVLESAVFANRAELRAKVNGILDDIEAQLAVRASAGEVAALAADATRLASRVGGVERDKADRVEIETLRTSVAAVRGGVDALRGRVDGLRADVQANSMQSEDARRTVSGRVDAAVGRLDAGEREHAEAVQRVAALIDDLARTRRAVDALRDGNQALAQRLAQLPSRENLAAAPARGEREAHPGSESSSAMPPATPDGGATTGAVDEEAFYVAFEDRFRGTREDIKARVAVYLPVVRAAGAGTADAPVLDLGCGRGEWLELLQEEGMHARGVDTNVVAVAGCRARGLDVVHADALEYLRGVPERSLGAVSAIHVIEHLPFAQVVELFDQARRVLREGGGVIFETPNPENLVVGACNFYYDPTHERPLPPEPFRFILESRGFERVEIVRLHPDARAADLGFLPAELADVLAQRLFGPQDYALVGFRR